MYLDSVKAIPAQSAAGKAYQLIKYDIIRCNLAPGQQVAQAQLAEKYRLGLTPIREALQQLSNEGFVQPFPRFGYLITPLHSDGIAELFEVRAILEPVAARLAASRGPERKLKRLIEIANFTYSHKDHESYAEFLSHNTDFHCSIADATGNSHLVDMICKVLDQLGRAFHLSIDLVDAAREMQSEHLALAQAIYARDEAQAAALCLSEIEISRQRVLRALATYPQFLEIPKRT